MKKKTKLVIMFCITVFISGNVLAAEDKFYEIMLSYDNGEIKLDNVVVKSGILGKKIQPGYGYKAELISFTEETLYSYIFEIPLTITVDILDPETGELSGELIELDKTNFLVTIPYFKNGKTIDIYSPDNVKVLSVDVGHFAQTCPSNICEPHESYENCPQDCPSGSKDDYCDKVKDDKCDPDCLIGDADCKEEKTKFPYWTLIPLLIIIIIIFVVYYRHKSKREYYSGG